MLKDREDILRWYESHRAEMTNDGVWFLGGEPGTQSPAAWAGAKLRVLIVRLSGYHDVATGITHSYLYQMARDVDGVFADLAFLPPHRDEALMRQDGVPLLTGTTSKRPAAEFDLIAISNSIVQELLNLPALLYHSGIPLTRQGRTGEKSPLIVLGGSNSSATAILHGPAGALQPGEGLVDGVVVGDGDDAFGQLLRILVAHRTASRVERLARVRENVAGYYDPSLYNHKYTESGRLAAIVPEAGAPFPVKANRADLSRLRRAHAKSPIWYDEDSAGASHVVVTAGCPYVCSFCKESWEQKPYRERPVDDVARDALELKAALGLHEIALYTFNANTYTGLMPLLDRLDPLFERVAIKSQRFDAIAKAPALLERQLAAGKRSYTCALEGISDRLRTLLQKGLSETRLMAGFDELFRRNVRQMKVFVIVTGFEEQADLDEFASFLSKIRKKLDGMKGRPVLTFSFATLFRPPHTPLQYAFPRPAPDELERIEQSLAALVRKTGFETRTSAGASDAVVSEYLAYGDRRCTPILVSASIVRNQRYRGEIDRETAAFWTQAVKRANLADVLFPRGEPGEVLPWDDIDVGVTKAFLLSNWNMLREGRELPSCIRPPWGSSQCSGCGACRSEVERARTLEAGPGEMSKSPAHPVASAKFVRFRVESQVPRRWAAVGNGFLGAAISRLLLLKLPGWLEPFVRVESVMERHKAFGVCFADVLLRGSPAVPANMAWPLVDDAPDGVESALRILSVKPAGKPIADDSRPFFLRFHLGPQTDRASISKRIDGMLAKYRYKHQKLWRGEFLHWEIQAGQAKKCGISKIRWPRDGAELLVDILHWPEPHLISQLGGADHVVEVLLISP
ncbi:MAG TPA: radical SAM protein [Candidatus Ozemobacteraceae bacterium]|nr:radical SAM protein [Candidatus Ozemobacteraceae bacterium]